MAAIFYRCFGNRVSLRFLVLHHRGHHAFFVLESAHACDFPGGQQRLSFLEAVWPTRCEIFTPHLPDHHFFPSHTDRYCGIQLDTLLLSIRGPSTELGAFFSAQRIVQVLYFFSQSIGIFASPIVASDFARKDFASITRQSRLAALGGLVITVPSALFLILFSDHILASFGQSLKTIGRLL